MKYHYVYKTMHTNGRYYIGRHTTDNLDDNYLGSGVWVVGIKDKSALKKEILYFAKNTDDLKSVEEQIILENYDNLLCMNRGLGSNGWTSEEASLENKKRLLNGTHNFIGGEIPRQNQLRRVAEGIHQWIGNKNPSVEKIKNGTHLWQSEEHKINTSINNNKRFNDGTHHFLSNAQCPHCNKIGQLTAMKRWHFENCKA
jgi:hypothetical protein